MVWEKCQPILVPHHGNQFFKTSIIPTIMYNRVMEKNMITQYFDEIETPKEYNGYFCSVAEAITIVILGSICGLEMYHVIIGSCTF